MKYLEKFLKPNGQNNIKQNSGSTNNCQVSVLSVRGMGVFENKKNDKEDSKTNQTTQIVKALVNNPANLKLADNRDNKIKNSVSEKCVTPQPTAPTLDLTQQSRPETKLHIY